MSLVNDMLRDLDQRRKESDGSGGAVRLLPARDFVKRSKLNPLPILLAVLLLVLVGLVGYWSQLSRTDVSQQLDLQVNPGVDSEQIVQNLRESIIEEQATAEEQNFVEAQATGAPTVAEPADEILNRALSARTIAEDVSENISSVPTPPAVVEVEAQSEVATANSAVPDTQTPSVKERPQYSNEQLDTIAVQKALSQISNGETEAALRTLEQYIILNRNAHLSRETYAKLLMSSGRVADATALIDAGLDMVPNHSGFKKVKARLLMASGNISEAVSILISRAPDLADDAEYHDLLATAQLSSREFAGALISYRELIEHDQTQGKWWYGYAASHDQLGNSSAARQAYIRAMQYPNLSANLRRRSQERVAALNP